MDGDQSRTQFMSNTLFKCLNGPGLQSVMQMIIHSEPLAIHVRQGNQRHRSVNPPGPSLLMRRPCDVMWWRGCVCVCVCVRSCKWVTARLNFRVILIRTRPSKDYTRDQIFHRAKVSDKGAQSTQFPPSLGSEHGHGVSTKRWRHRTLCISGVKPFQPHRGRDSRTMLLSEPTNYTDYKCNHLVLNETNQVWFN